MTDEKKPVPEKPQDKPAEPSTVVCHAKREKLTSKIQKSHFRKNAIIGITKPS